MNAAKAFFDTNVLLYIYSQADRKKQSRARELFQEHAQNGSLLLSTQVVQEFYAAGSRKMGIPRRALRDAVAALLELPLVVINAPQIAFAIEMEERHRISFWDALILSAAVSGSADVVYSEDLSHGQRYGPVLVRNPFAEPDGRSAATGK
jgi:predicted nucleic acid-binding protein